MPMPGVQKGSNDGGKGVAPNKGSSMVHSKTIDSICLINPNILRSGATRRAMLQSKRKVPESGRTKKILYLLIALIRIKTCTTSKNGLPVYHKNP